MTIALVAGSGGHLKQLHMISGELRGFKTWWITDLNDQSASLLEGEKVTWLPRSRPRQLWKVLLNAVTLARTFDSSCSTVVSTGAGVALSAYLACRIRNIPFIYIESATRVRELSLTGKVIERLPSVKRVVQHPELASCLWTYWGSLLDQFEVQDGPELPQSAIKVFVTVGVNQEYGFDRLFEKLQTFPKGRFDFVCQWGPVTGNFIGMRGSSWMTYEEVCLNIRDADVVISHAGTGSLLTALEFGKSPILVARTSQNSEHVDDHQSDLARYAGQRNLALIEEASDITPDALFAAARRRVVYRDSPDSLAKTLAVHILAEAREDDGKA